MVSEKMLVKKYSQDHRNGNEDIAELEAYGSLLTHTSNLNIEEENNGYAFIS